MASAWSTWSRSLRCTPSHVVEPENEERIVSVVRRAARVGQMVRVVGAGHSSSPLVATTGVLVSSRPSRSPLMDSGVDRFSQLHTSARTAPPPGAISNQPAVG
ncbi:MAG: FAD-binding protein [Thermomicrobiales bacterium]